MTGAMRCVLIALAGVFVVQWGVHAGSAAGGDPQFSAEQLVRLSKQVEREIASRGARVALVSRVGRPSAELPEGIEFTHVGIAVYSLITTSDGRTVPGYAMYNLYQSDERPNTSFLKQDYPLDYYAAVYELKAGVIIPSPELQQKLLEVVLSDIYDQLHNPRYSAISNPFNDQFQNCTEFVLDVMNAAIYDTGDVRLIKANEAAYFEPEPVRVGAFKLLLGSIFTPDITTSDHAGPVATATFGSIARYMQKYGIANEVFTVTLD
ncbi:MAG: DUF2145 domain-containing protein [Gammaproteobacteria bacterium]|nr:DUF2145 domain-containing protein [Gammaproteobacteria bacterium]